MNIGSQGQLTSNSQRPQQENEVAGFIFKTFEILASEEFQKIIYWASNGLQFVIKDVVKFEQIILPRYFRHNKMNSFVRQLNMYGFHKIKHNHFKSTFRHEFFQKDREDMLPLIKRKPKLNDKENDEVSEQVKILAPVKIEKRPAPIIKQEEPTMAHQQWENISKEFLATTKMINLSLIKVTCNELTDIVNFIPEEDDCVSIEEELERNNENEEANMNYFEDPSCFFASRFDI